MEKVEWVGSVCNYQRLHWREFGCKQNVTMDDNQNTLRMRRMVQRTNLHRISCLNYDVKVPFVRKGQRWSSSSSKKRFASCWEKLRGMFSNTPTHQPTGARTEKGSKRRSRGLMPCNSGSKELLWRWLPLALGAVTTFNHTELDCQEVRWCWLIRGSFD